MRSCSNQLRRRTTFRFRGGAKPVVKVVGEIVAFGCCLSALVFANAKMCHADIITFSDRASWEAVVSGITTIDFNDVTSDTYIDPGFGGGPFDAGPFVITETGTQNQPTQIDAPPTSAANVDIDGSSYLLSSLQNVFSGPPSRETTLTYDSSIVAWGADVRSRFGGERVQYDFVGAGQVSDPVDTSVSFFGMVSTVGFSEIRMTSNFASSFGFDNIASAQFSSIPEPTSLALFAGIGALGMVRRRRSR